jgi:nitroreductase
MARTPQHPVDPLFPRRWSPRAMSGAPVARDSLLTLLEAARWAPSGGNGQPWRFVYGLGGTQAFDSLLAALVPTNREWAHRAGALVLLAAKTVRDDGRPAPSAAFDAGAAWMAFALQGTLSGLVVHAMGGFDREAARAAARLPPGVEPQVVVAVGHPGRVEDLPERLRPREQPSDRLPVEAIASEGPTSSRS